MLTPPAPMTPDEPTDPAAAAFWNEVFPEGLPPGGGRLATAPAAAAEAGGMRLIPVDYDPFAAAGRSSAGSAAAPRTFSDGDLAQMGAHDLLSIVTRSDLSDADRDAIDDRLNQLEGS